MGVYFKIAVLSPRVRSTLNLSQNLWATSFTSGQHMWWDVTSVDRSDGADTPALMSRYYTCQSLELGHSQPHAQQDRWHGPAHTHWHAICHRSSHAHCKHSRKHRHAHTHTHTHMQTHLIYKETLSGRIRSPPARPTVWTCERRAQTDSQGRQMSWKWQGGNKESAFARITLHCCAFSPGGWSSNGFSFPLKSLSIKTNQRGGSSLRHSTCLHSEEAAEGRCQEDEFHNLVWSQLCNYITQCGS